MCIVGFGTALIAFAATGAGMSARACARARNACARRFSASSTTSLTESFAGFAFFFAAVFVAIRSLLGYGSDLLATFPTRRNRYRSALVSLAAYGRDIGCCVVVIADAHNLV